MIKKIKAVIFDLDYTLYDATDFWLGLFHRIADYLYTQEGISKQKTYSILKRIFEEKTYTYGNLFDDTLDELCINNPNSIAQLKQIYEEYSPFNIKPYKDVKKILEELKRNYKLGVISNGKYHIQTRKLKSLGIDNFFDEIICPNPPERKPSPKPFFEMVRRLKINLGEMIYVGDNPLEDFSIKKEGIKTVRIFKGPFKSYIASEENDGDYKINELRELIPLLQNE